MIASTFQSQLIKTYVKNEISIKLNKYIQKFEHNMSMSHKNSSSKVAELKKLRHLSTFQVNKNKTFDEVDPGMVASQAMQIEK